MIWSCNAGGKGRESGAGQLSVEKGLLPAPDAAVSDFLHFFRSWIRNPLCVAAVAPSGDSLARLMTQEIAPIDGPIIELGPGTGVFTRALLARGVSESDLTLIEYGTEFVPGLKRRFPKARVLQMDAAKLHSGDLFEGQPVGAVVSGLPILSMSPRKVTAILLGAFTHLRPGAPSISLPMVRGARFPGRSSIGWASRLPISAGPCAICLRRPYIKSPGGGRSIMSAASESLEMKHRLKRGPPGGTRTTDAASRL
jgi:phospholipid N-methyltransferase